MVRRALRPAPISLAVLVLFAAGYFYFTRDVLPGREILKNADRVEVFKVGSRALANSPVPHVQSFPIVRTGLELDREAAQKLGRLLNGPGVFRNQTKCVLQPSAAFRVWSGSRSVDVLLDFNCPLLWSHETGVPLDEHSRQEWKSLDEATVGELKRIAEAEFPSGDQKAD